MHSIREWFIHLGDNTSFFGKMVITFTIAILPIIELRGAIPVGIALNLPHLTTFITAYLGNMLPVPFIILFIRKIFAWMKTKSSWMGRVANWFEQKAHLKGEKVKKYRVLGLLLFVAIPLPGTGAWTGSLIAAILDMRMRDALPTIALGVLIAGILMTGITMGFEFFIS